ncbi:hypothetical protein V4U86_26580 [Mycobacterium sp. AMU20-3851]|uniref:hypothetical protein n=1 Tax=Mycobacterium sp. AMU20-3851 TaxID=3122055 RepID=UPI00375413FC
MAIKAAPRTDSRLAARCAALASLGAAVVHFAVVPAHWREWPLSGVFFAVLALLQLMWVRAVLVRTTTPILAAGILLNGGAIALWVLSRTAGAPFGPHAGQPEVVQGADLAALMLQIYVVMGAGWIWYRGLQGEPVSALASAAVLFGAVGVVTLASTVGVVSGQRHGHHHGPADAGTDHHGPVQADTGHHGSEVEHAGDHHGDNHHGQAPAPAVPLNVTPVAPPQAPSADPAPPAQAPVAPAQSLHDHSSHEH